MKKTVVTVLICFSVGCLAACGDNSEKQASVINKLAQGCNGPFAIEVKIGSWDNYLKAKCNDVKREAVE